MNEQKKEPTPAKGLTRIGNRLHGNFNLHNQLTCCNAIKDGRNMAYLFRNMQSGFIVFLNIFRALEAIYMPFFDCDFRDSFYSALWEEYAE